MGNLASGQLVFFFFISWTFLNHFSISSNTRSLISCFHSFVNSEPKSVNIQNVSQRCSSFSPFLWFVCLLSFFLRKTEPFLEQQKQKPKLLLANHHRNSLLWKGRPLIIPTRSSISFKGSCQIAKWIDVFHNKPTTRNFCVPIRWINFVLVRCCHWGYQYSFDSFFSFFFCFVPFLIINEKAYENLSFDLTIEFPATYPHTGFCFFFVVLFQSSSFST